MCGRKVLQREKCECRWGLQGEKANTLLVVVRQRAGRGLRDAGGGGARVASQRPLSETGFLAHPPDTLTCVVHCKLRYKGHFFSLNKSQMFDKLAFQRSSHCRSLAGVGRG